MKPCACFILLAFIASFAYALEFSLDDVHMFLPFLEKLKPPPECPPNELYKNCMGNCSYCTNRGNCVIEHCLEGCDCAPRFYRLEPGGPCMPVAKCPIPECGENEIFRECGPLCERCTMYKCRIINCDHKCYCKEGYMRNNEGKCIPEEECPKKQHCFVTEEWKESGPVDEFCLQRNNTAVNETQDVEQCYCKPEHKRNMFGFCIRDKLCSLIKCLGYEIYHECIPKCNTTCRNYGDPNCSEDDNCYPGCFCPPGYVMNDFRACVLVEDCKPDTEHVLVIADAEYEESTDVEITTTVKYDESAAEENATEISSNCETTEDYVNSPGVNSKTSTNPADNRETFPVDKAQTVSVESTTKPSESSTRANGQSNKSRRKMKTSKSSSASASTASAKRQNTGNEDYINNEEF